MSEEKNWKKIVLYLFDPSFIFELGKYIALLVGAVMIVEWMINFYINTGINIANEHIFTVVFMFAVMSVPIALSCYFLSEIFGDNKNE